MRIGIAFDLRADFQAAAHEPDDRYEEFDSLATVEAIEAAITLRGHMTERLGGGRRFLAAVLEKPCDLVFNLAEGFGSRSREAHVPAVCEMLGLAVTHSDPLALALSLDKALAKRVVASHGCATPAFAVLERAADARELRLEYPLFAKPLFEGSSMGVRQHSRCETPQELEERVAAIVRDYGQAALVEEFCSGPEFTVGILGTGATARILGVMEVVPKRVPAERFVYSLEVKRSGDWHSEIGYELPPRRPRAVVEELERVALTAHRALGCRDVSRVDVRLDRRGCACFLEINPLPGLRPGWSDLALMAELLGLSHDALIGAILDEARARLAR